MKRLLGRLLCMATGHKRGKRVSPTAVRCPRCGREAPRAERKKVM